MTLTELEQLSQLYQRFRRRKYNLEKVMRLCQETIISVCESKQLKRYEDSEGTLLLIHSNGELKITTLEKRKRQNANLRI